MQKLKAAHMMRPLKKHLGLGNPQKNVGIRTDRALCDEGVA